MCGIAGSIGNLNVNVAKVLSRIAHRGPDSKGSFFENEVLLCHTRLSIQDLSENGNQPMFSDDGRHVIIFNGEIYNHIEIRESLDDSHDFKSTGDTETVLYTYRKYGVDCLNMLNGIFAFAIYDREKQEIFLARDQMGVKPLYVYRDNHLFLFSSEIKTFLEFSINKEINAEALVNYLTFLWSPGDATPFSNVIKLLPGHYIKGHVSKVNTLIPHQYYQIPVSNDYSEDTEQVLIDLLEQKLLTAVKRQMLSDVPVGFFLSGGLDSSLIVAMAKKMFPEKRFQCFTIDIDGWSDGIEDFTEDITYAHQVAAYLNVELNVVKANVDIINDFDKMVWHLDEPQADAAPLNVLNIASLAREKGIKVLLGGTGGDDLFSGYRRHQALRMERYLKFLPTSLAKGIKKIANLMPGNTTLVRRLKKVTQGLDTSANKRMAGYFSWLPYDKVYELFSSDFRNRIGTFSPLTYFEKLDRQIPQDTDILNRMLFWEMKTFLVDHNLNYTDKMGMSQGVEVRVPFLDLDLVEFAMKIPPQFKMNGTCTKYILKKVAEKYLPHSVIYRPKTGFGAPVRKWIINDMDALINERLSPERLKANGVFDADKVWSLINDNKVGKLDASYSILAILSIDSWITQYVHNR